MKKRLILKTFSVDYYTLWFHEESSNFIPIPRNPRCWYLMRKAIYKIGGPDKLRKFEQKIKEIASQHCL